MKIGNIGSTQSFKAQFSPRVEEGFKKLGNGILAGYGKGSKEYKEYLESVIKIKSACPDAEIDIEDYYEKKQISGGSGWSASGDTSVHYNAYVMKTKYLPNQILEKVENTKDLFSLETFKQLSERVFMNRNLIYNKAVNESDYYTNKVGMFLENRDKSTKYLKDEINPVIEKVYKVADECEKWEYKPEADALNKFKIIEQ